MQKPSSRILSMLLALAMILTMLPAAVFAEGETDALKQWSVTLGDNIGVNFYLDSADYTVTATVNGAEVTPSISGDVATVDVAAAQMNDTIVLTVKSGEETVHTGEYSVRQYADTILNGSYDAEVKAMVKQMLNYGAAAQTYFNYNTENLATDGVSGIVDVEVPDTIDPMSVEGAVEGIRYYGATLVFKSKTAVRFYFNVTGDIGTYTFKVGETSYEPVESGSLYYVEVDGILPQDLDDVITLTVSDSLSVGYSPLHYIVRMCAKGSEALKPLLAAMYGYHKEAENYQEYLKIIQAGTMSSHANGVDLDNANSNDGVYFTLDANTASYNTDWSVEYKPVSASAIKLVRDGEEYDVAVPDSGTIVKYGETDYYLKLVAWTVSGSKLPLAANDYLIIEGRFTHEASGTTIQISKSYIYYDGTNVEFSTTVPVLPTTVDAGLMQTHANGMSSTGLYFSMDANAAPYDGWSIEYAQTSVDNIKLIRDGVTTSIGIVDRPLLIKYSDTEYYLKLETWTIGDYGLNNTTAPITTDDVLIIEGSFYHAASKVTLNVTKSYVYYDGSAWVCSATEPIQPTVIDAGYMSNASGTSSNGLYFSMAANDAPYDGWSLRYTPTATENVQLIRNGVTYNVGNTGYETIVKTSDTGYFLEYNALSGYGPLMAGDVLIVEGSFVNAANKVTLNISKTYGLVKEDGTATFATAFVDAGEVTGMAGAQVESDTNYIKGLYFNLPENAAPQDGWGTNGYVPVSAGNLQLIRNNVTTDIGSTGYGCLLKVESAKYYLRFEKYNSDTIITEDDIIVLGGDFVYTDTDGNATIMRLNQTYIYYDGSAWVCSATEPELSATIVDAGNMTASENGWEDSTIYFTMDTNAVPVDEEAVVEYTAAAGVIKLVSGETTTELSGCVIKYADTEYTLNLTDCVLQDGEYLIVEGYFVNDSNKYTVNISKTYILNDNGTLVFSTTEPEIDSAIEVSALTERSDGILYTTNETLIYATGEANDVPYGDGVEYTPVSASGLKLIRDGVTYEVGNPGQGTVVHDHETQYIVKLAAWTVTGSKLPVEKGDIIVVEGQYTQTADSSVVVNFATTYILIAGESKALFFTEEPNVVHAGTMSAHSNARTANGFYAKTDANNAAYDTTWSLRYKPVAADAVKFVSGGTTTSVANTGGEMLVKYSESEYFFEGWTLSGTFANAAGNTYIIDGLFYNAANDVYIDIDRTYVMITADDEIFYHIEGGTMSSHASGTGSDGIYVTMAANNLPVKDWLTELAPATADAYKIIRDGQTLSIGQPGRGTLVKTGETDYYLKTSGWCLNGEAVTTDDIIIVEGIFIGTGNNADAEGIAMYISKTYIYYDGTAWAFSTTEPAQKTIVELTDLGSHSNGWTGQTFNEDGTTADWGSVRFTAAENDAPYNTQWSLRYTPVSTDVVKLIRDGVETNVANTGAETIVKYSATEYAMVFWPISLKPIVAGDVLVIEGRFYNAANDVYIDIEKTTVTINEDGSADVISESDKYINAGAMSAYAVQNWFGDSSIYFAMASNIAPGAEDWSVRYTPASTDNVKLIRNGSTVSIGNTAAETIVKVSGGVYALALDSWWWSGYAPIVDGDVLIIEGEFKNASNGYTLNIEKTYITFVSKANDEVIFSTVADTEFGEVLLPNSADTLNIGMWNGSYHVFTEDKLAELQAAGITKIMGVDTQWIGTDDVNAWLDRVYSYGISVIMDLRSWDGTTVPSYAEHPGLLGFLMYDEPCATDFDTLAELKTKFDAVMPEGKLFYVNLYPECAADSSLVGVGNDLLGKDDYDEYYVSQFLAKLDVEVLSWDNYSLLSGSGIRTDYFHNFEVMASKNTTMWYTMLSAGHGTTSASYSTPTEAELRWQMAVAMTYGVSNIDHYVYTSHEEDYSCMVEYDTWETTDLYNDIVTVDNEYLAWDNIYMAYDWIGVGTYSANSNNSMLSQLENTLTLSDYGLSVSADENLLVGVFQNNGQNAYMVTNAGSSGSTTVGDGKNFSMDGATVTLTLGEGSYKCVAVIDNGEISYVAVNADNTVSINVEAYEGVFVIPVLN